MRPLLEDLTNQQILESLRLGDQNAFHEFYRRYSRKVSTFAYRFVKDKEEAKDLAQEVFIKFWESREKVDADKSPEVLLFIMVRSRFLDALKRKTNQKQYLSYEDEHDFISSITDEYLDMKDCSKIISLAIHTLPNQAKAAYLLSREDGWTHQEIAHHLQISKKTVNNQITSSMRHIRGYFKRLSPDTVLIWLLLVLQISLASYFSQPATEDSTDITRFSQTHIKVS